MNKKKHMLILSFTDAARDPRVYRQAEYFRHKYRVTVAAPASPDIENTDFLQIEHRPACNPVERLWRAGTLLCGFSKPFLARFALQNPEAAIVQNFDLVLVNDEEPLPLGFTLAKGAPVVFDAHEYYPEAYNDFYWRVFHKRHSTRLCRHYIPRVSGMTTVCPGIARLYQKHFGVLPEVVYNTPPYQELPVLKIASPKTIRLIHHGSASKDRKLETMFDMMEYVDTRFSLDLMLIGETRYLDSLRQRTEGKKNITWKEPVPMLELPSVLNTYDMGVYCIAPTSVNNFYSLPNKFFEYIQARIGVIIGPSPEMAAIVNEYKCGIVAADFSASAMAAKLNALTTEDILHFKHNSGKTARIYNARESMKIMSRVLREALIQGRYA
jgi:glycosyltransferase involved in cell wall biosynthesis